MKIEVGMYVRTERGKIWLVTSTKAIDGHKRRIVNADYDIRKLLQSGDYVNGSEVMDADWINENGEYEEGLAFPMYASDDLEVIENWLPLRCVEIKSIVTKEQFEQIEYKVGE